MKNNITRVLTKIIGPFLLILLAGCVSTPNTDILFHELAVPMSQRQNKDKSFDLPFNAYVIGVEKANRSKIGSLEECGANQQDDRCLNINSEYYSENQALQGRLKAIYTGQHRPTFVSHVAKFSTDPTFSKCFLYNIYDQSLLCNEKTSTLPQKGRYVSKSWDVLLGLGPVISNDIQTIKPTHFLVYFMGWNTPQWEAMKNYRDLFSSLTAAAREVNTNDFRPLFIGITWPATGSPTVAASDYGIKAKDADEVGLVWGNIVINRVLSDLKTRYGIPIVVVGHSFGARASSRAVFSAALISEEHSRKNVDLLVGLQGAYSFQRYIAGAGTEGSPYSNFSKEAGKVVLTSSSFDTAVTEAGHKDYFVGSNSVYEITKHPEYSTYFEHVKINSQGLMDTPSVTCESSKVELVDASSVINKNQSGTGGGAHSFIYGIEIGRLAFQFISACTPLKENSQRN